MYAVSMMNVEPKVITNDPWTGEPIEFLPEGMSLLDLPGAVEVRFPSDISRGEPDYETMHENRLWAKGWL